MPLVIIRRQKRAFKRAQAIKLRDAMIPIIAKHLKVKASEVEVRIRKVKKDDINCPALAIEIHTGNGARRWRLTSRKALATGIARDIAKTGIVPRRMFDPIRGPYAWLRVVGSAFVPLGFPQCVR